MNEPEYKQVEVTFKYLLPEHQNEFNLAVNADLLRRILYEIDNMCRDVTKYNNNPDESRLDFAERIREKIYSEIDINNLVD